MIQNRIQRETYELLKSSPVELTASQVAYHISVPYYHAKSAIRSLMNKGLVEEVQISPSRSAYVASSTTNTLTRYSTYSTPPVQSKSGIISPHGDGSG